jgi:hypothetical protein
MSFAGRGLVEGPGLLEQVLERLLRVLQVSERDLAPLRAHGLDVEADPFALLPVVVTLEHTHLVERAAQVDRAKALSWSYLSPF